MDYKLKQQQAKQSTKPRLLTEDEYSDFDKHVMAQMTVFNSRKARRKKFASKPALTKKRHKGHKR